MHEKVPKYAKSILTRDRIYMHEKVPKYANFGKFHKNFLKYANFLMQFFDFYCIKKKTKICKIKLVLKHSKYHKNTIYISRNPFRALARNMHLHINPVPNYNNS